MESEVEQFEKFLSQFSNDGYLAIGIGFILLLVIIHSYLLIQAKKKLRQM